ncbi:uncharacterized protein LOC115889021 [Sitophilus oryzae]|uniref:Uncharacterized protein LOC115889021 n=1 Tax=Sitophilus oryzae TaxID=7048 RepID=A0A6J2YNE5_SITOR|nr:uncharacterized protein LOC115889021 [Sitophilus oryzae]
MKLVISVLLSLIVSIQIFSSQTTDSNNTSHDYIVQLKYQVSEAKLPTYVVNLIYDSSNNVSIPPKDVLDLFKANSLTINSTLQILTSLNISSSVVFSTDGLNKTIEFLNITFTDFYNNVRSGLNISGSSIRPALEALGIDANAFSDAIAYETEDPWTLFEKGNFTKENVESACNLTGITIDDLFSYIRNLVYDNVILTTNLTNLLQRYSISKQEALTIWNAHGISSADVNNAILFKTLIDDVTTKLNSSVALGIFTQLQEVFVSVNKKSYNFFKSALDLVIVQADSVNTNNSYTLISSSINDTAYDNIVLLQRSELSPNDNGTIPTIEVGYSNQTLLNCSYVTLQNNSIFSVNVPEAVYNNDTYEISSNVTNSVIEGSALICNATVYGLAREAANDTIIIDLFKVAVQEENNDASSVKISLISLTVISVLIRLF